MEEEVSPPEEGSPPLATTKISHEQVIAQHMEAQRQRLADEMEKEEVFATEEIVGVNVKDILGIVLVTSVLSIHPSTDMIEAVMATHVKKQPELEQCSKIVVCDTPKLAKNADKTKFKSGRVLPDDVARYEEYVKRLEQLCEVGKWPWTHCRVVRMSKYGGFGFSLKTGLQMIGKRYALVLQHDRILRCSFDVCDVLMTMEKRPRIKYIGLASNSSVGAEARYRTMGIPVHTGALETQNGRKLCPLPFWYDSTHIARIDFYLDFVFGWHAFAGTQYSKPFRLRTGDFPEDKLGNAMLAYMKLNGMKAHVLFGCFLLDDNKTVFCRHVHGRKINSCSQRQLSNYVSKDDVTEFSDDEQ